MAGTPSLTSTQFTQTQPHATSKPAPPPSRSPSASSSSTSPSSINPSSRPPRPSPYGIAPPGETPQQKVQRLRSAARAAKLKREYDPVEAMIARGRSWADLAHRGFTWTLIGATGVAALVTIYSFYDLVGHNRRQKAIFMTRELEKLKHASMAVAAGNATPEQLDIVKREQLTREEAQQKQRERETRERASFFTRGRDWLFGGLETPGGKVVGELEGGETEGERFGILEKVEELVERENGARNLEGALQPGVTAGGSLDQMADKLVTRIDEEKRGWWGRVWGSGGGEGKGSS